MLLQGFLHVIKVEKGCLCAFNFEEGSLFQQEIASVYKVSSIKTWFYEFGVEELKWP